MARREEEEAEDLHNGNMGELEDNLYNGSMWVHGRHSVPANWGHLGLGQEGEEDQEAGQANSQTDCVGQVQAQVGLKVQINVQVKVHV